MRSLARTSRSLLLVLALAGCASSPATRHYTLSAPVPPETRAGTPAGLAVSVGPVAIPAVVDRPQIVTALGPNEVWPDEFNRWASPLADGVGLAVVGHLAVALPSPNVVLLTQSADGPAQTQVAIEIQRFDSVPGSHALLDALVTVRNASTGRVVVTRTTVREPSPDRSYDALVAAHSRAVARLSADIATAIRAAALPAAGSSPAR